MFLNIILSPQTFAQTFAGFCFKLGCCEAVFFYGYLQQKIQNTPSLIIDKQGFGRMMDQKE
jgi:hypothetical protein